MVGIIETCGNHYWWRNDCELKISEILSALFANGCRGNATFCAELTVDGCCSKTTTMDRKIFKVHTMETECRDDVRKLLWTEINEHVKDVYRKVVKFCLAMSEEWVSALPSSFRCRQGSLKAVANSVPVVENKRDNSFLFLHVDTRRQKADNRSCLFI